MTTTCPTGRALPANADLRAADPRLTATEVLAVVLGVTGVAAEGLGYLLFIGIAVLVAALAFAGVRWSHRAGRHSAR